MNAADSARRRAQVQRAATWSGVVMAVLFFVGLGLIAHFVPPPPPTRTAEAVAQYFDEHNVRIRIGIFIMMGASTLLAPFTAAIAMQVRRIEGGPSLLAYIQVMCGACLVIVFLLPSIVWQVAAYRQDRSPETIQALNDLAWIPFIGLVTEFILQAVVIAIAVLRDHRSEPILPRWLAYLNVFAACGAVPAGMNVFFQNGPVAWNGVLAWWMLIAVFFAWLVGMVYTLLRAIARQETKEAADGNSSTEADRRIDELEARVDALTRCRRRAVACVRPPPAPNHIKGRQGLVSVGRDHEFRSCAFRPRTCGLRLARRGTVSRGGRRLPKWRGFR